MSITKNITVKRIRNKNLTYLVLENSNSCLGMSHNPEKVMFNFSSHELSDYEKSLLCKGFNFSIPPKRLAYADHILPFELLFRDINKDEMSNEGKEFIKTRRKDSAFTSYRSYNYNIEINLTKIERLAFNNLTNNKNIIIQKYEKGNSVVLLDKDKYNLKECLKYQRRTLSLKCFNLIMIRSSIIF